MNIFKYKSNNEDLGNTSVENIFINHYMPQAPGDYVKVYLLGLKYALGHANNTLSNEIIAKTLNITCEEVIKAWKYWEHQEIIKLHSYASDTNSADFTIEFLNIKEIMLNIKEPKPETNKYSPERIINARQNFKVKDMFDYMRKVMGRELSQNEIFTFLDWIDDYLFPPELIILIIEDCYSRNKKDLPYLKQVAKNWYDAGISTIEQASDYMSKHKEKWLKYSKVLNFLRLGRQPTALEEEMMYKWFYTFSYSEEIVLKACELTSNTYKPSFSYIDKILTEWKNSNLINAQQIEEYITKSTKKQSKENHKGNQSQKPTFNNFTNRTYDTKLLKEKLLKKSRGELIE